MFDNNDTNQWIIDQMIIMFKHERMFRGLCIDVVNQQKKGLRKLFRTKSEKREMFYLKYLADCLQKLYLIRENNSDPTAFAPYKTNRFVLNRMEDLFNSELQEVEESVSNETIWRDGSTEREDYRMHSENIIRYQMYATVLKAILGGLNDEKLVRS